MSAPAYKPPHSMQGDKKELQGDGVVHNLRITLVAQRVDILENTCAELIRVRLLQLYLHRMCTFNLQSAKAKDLKVRGPVRMPTKTLRITCRKTPCGEGSKTWDRYQMRIHKRVISVQSTHNLLREVLIIVLELLSTIISFLDHRHQHRPRRRH